jgi:hypothetical protein
MELYVSKSHSDENDAKTIVGKYGIIVSSKEDILRLCSFFENIKEHIKKNDTCHMHFRDSFSEWDKDAHIDLAINIEQ